MLGGNGTLEPRTVTIPSASWLETTTQLNAIVLLGANLGELVVPVEQSEDRLCSRFSGVPIGHGLLAAHHSSLRRMSRHEPVQNVVRLGDSYSWVRLAQTDVCTGCLSKKHSKPCEPSLARFYKSQEKAIGDHPESAASTSADPKGASMFGEMRKLLRKKRSNHEMLEPMQAANMAQRGGSDSGVDVQSSSSSSSTNTRSSAEVPYRLVPGASGE